MLYRQLGRTGLRVSQLGFGAMRLPMKSAAAGAGNGEQVVNRELAIPMILRAFEGGVNYIDTAVGYCEGDSQRAVGEALKAWRAKSTIPIVVSTKNPDYGTDEKTWWKNLENSLKRLQVDSIDIYNHHGIGWKRYQEHVAPRLAGWMAKAKDQGLIRHICASFHDNNEALMNIVDTGYVSVITLQYNLLDRQLEEGIAYAHEKGIGVVVMGPVGGGRLGVESEVLSSLLPGVARVPELALRFVLANPTVTVALSGMSTMAQVEENLITAADPVSLSEADQAAIASHLERLQSLAGLYCTGCGYCLPCPSGINIPGVFEKFNRGRVWGLWDSARAAYAQIGKTPWDKSQPADICGDCGQCEDKCPQNLPIRKQLKEAHKELGKV